MKKRSQHNSEKWDLSDIDRIIHAARNIGVEPNLKEGLREVTPGVYLFAGHDVMYFTGKQTWYHAVCYGTNIHIEQRDGFML